MLDMQLPLILFFSIGMAGHQYKVLSTMLCRRASCPLNLCKQAVCKHSVFSVCCFTYLLYWESVSLSQAVMP